MEEKKADNRSESTLFEVNRSFYMAVTEKEPISFQHSEEEKELEEISTEPQFLNWKRKALLQK